MKLEDLKGQYDAIFSLGDLCLASIQLRKNNLRPFAGPLDWMSSPSLPSVSRLLRNRFEGFMDISNLTPTGYSTGVDTAEPFLCVTDNGYQIVSSHDFKADRNTFVHLATYPEVRRKLDRRIARFLNKAQRGKRLLFVRTEGSFEEVLNLESALSQVVRHDFNILLVNHSPVSGIVEREWPIDRVCVLDLPDTEKWEGNNHHWKLILDGITCKD